jgi:Transposase DNA-binding/Transposase DDE domain
MPNKHVRGRRGHVVADANPPSAWVDQELADCEFKDERLGKRFRSLLAQLSSSPGDSIPLVCQDWANTKAAYRFLDNDRVSEAEILAGHFHATRDRAKATTGPILVLHDTTEFSYKREDVEAVGKTRINIAGAYNDGRLRLYTACGILMHSSLAVTTDGLPLGLTAIKFWSREKFKGANALKKKINPTRVPIEEKESIRWLENLRQSSALLSDAARCVHIGDRESDIYELFCAAKDEGTHFLLRTCVDRLAGKGEHTIATEMAETRCKGLHRIEVRDRRGEVSEAVLEIKFRRTRVLPPIYKQGRYPALDLTVLHATERGKPRGRDRIDWKLITDLPVTSRAEAIEKLQWYALRWKIETFHKILKSGCRAEQSKLRTAERLVNLLATFCILSWRIFWLTMLNRSTRQAKPTLAFTLLEIDLLNRLADGHHPSRSRGPPTLHSCLTQLACLGGYLNRTGDASPGNTVIWRGLSRLTDIEIGYLLGLQHVGN